MNTITLQTRTAGAACLRPKGLRASPLGSGKALTVRAAAQVGRQQQKQARREVVTVPSLPLAAIAAQPMLLLTALPAVADDALPSLDGNPVTSFFNSLSPAGVALALSPLVLYLIFNIYRAQINPRAKWSDFVFVFAALAIGGNLISIIFFKLRLF